MITPEWSDGDSTYNIGAGIGGLIGSVVPLEKTAIEGPWDKGRVDGTTGASGCVETRRAGDAATGVVAIA